MEIVKRELNFTQLDIMNIQYANNLEEANYEYKKLKTDLKEINYNIITSELILSHRFDSYIPSHYGKEQADYNTPHAKCILTQHKLNRKSVYYKFAHTAKPRLRKWTILSYKMNLAYEWANQVLMERLVNYDPFLSKLPDIGSEEWRDDAEKMMNTAKITVEVTDPEEYGKGKKQTVEIRIKLPDGNEVNCLF